MGGENGRQMRGRRYLRIFRGSGANVTKMLGERFMQPLASG
jgi:hypothetical protein